MGLLQETVAKTNGATSSTSVTSNALANPLTVGSTLEVAYACVNGLTINSVVDSAGNTYSLVGTIADVPNTSALYCYQFANNQSNASGVTVTVTLNSSQPNQNVQLREQGGITTAGVIASAFVKLTNPGAGTDALSITSGSVGAATQPFLISSCCVVTAGSTAPVAGTGFAGTTHFTTGAGFGNSLFETKTSASSGAQTATYTDSAGAASTFLAYVVVYELTPTGKLLLSSNQGGF